MFTISRGQQITKDVIISAIEWNDKRAGRYIDLERYYVGKHDIQKRKKSGDALFNNRVLVNHAKYITDVNVGYLLGNPVQYNIDDKYKQTRDVILDMYKRQTISDLDHEIAKDLSVLGDQIEFEYNIGKEVFSVDIDNKNVVLIYDDTVMHELLGAVMYEKSGKDKFSKVILVDKFNMTNYCDKDGNINLEGIPTPHQFQTVPFVDFRNNTERQGDFEQAIQMIDAYNILQSDRVNDKEQLVSALLVLKGFGFTKEQRSDIKNRRILENLPIDADAYYLTKVLNEADVDVLRRTIEQDIHKITMTPNLSDENFVGNSSGVAIKYKLLAFEQNIQNKERYFEKGLKRRFEIYNLFLNKISSTPIIPLHEIDVVFQRNLPQNDFETSQMINNLIGTGIISKVTLGTQLSFNKNPEDEIEKAKKEQAEETQADENDNFGTGEPNTNPNENVDQNIDDKTKKQDIQK